MSPRNGPSAPESTAGTSGGQWLTREAVAGILGYMELNPEYAQQCLQRATVTWDNVAPTGPRHEPPPPGSWLEAVEDVA